MQRADSAVCREVTVKEKPVETKVSGRSYIYVTDSVLGSPQLYACVTLRFNFAGVGHISSTV